ncbi:hypothetical protein SLS56_005258 [Neofusicoccum ribis]|uniref:Peroxidase n=1 Tax=Neofusicoccum ribis TaxID=45134 RepID=A0ABR3STY0_9PEZI
MKTFALAGLSLLQSLPSAAEYVWPSKYDYMEDLLYLQSGYIREGFRDGVTPCDFSSAGAGRQTAAEWVRTAYHDMATHDAAAATGGLDASIMFETERDENVGDAFNGTFGFTNNYYNIRASAADLIALSTVVAVGSCGGLQIPLRAGRVDATEAGPLGVPKPDQDIDTHTNIFAKAGFNTSDMITMVACGHTLGGVHGVDFPEITFNDSATNFEHFENDDSFHSFDNAVVTEYLSGNTSNPLVAGKNETNNSDKRVFGADGNATMHTLSDPATFQSSCASILARMIDTVPAGVTLSEPLEPSPIKPYITTFALTNATHLTLTGRIRVLTTFDAYADQSVHLTYTPRHASNATLNTTITTTRATYKLGTSSGLFGEVFAWHEFSVALPAASSIAAFNVTVVRVSTGAAAVHDNAGHGFPLVDDVLHQASQSCLDTSSGASGPLTVVAAVRRERAGEKVGVEVARKVERPGVAVPRIDVERVEMVEGEALGEWVVFKGTTELASESWSTSFDVVLGEGEAESRVEFQRTNGLRAEGCEAL